MILFSKKKAEKKIATLEYYRKVVLEQKINNERIRKSNDSLNINPLSTYAIIDDLDINRDSGIYIMKLDCPVEAWMLERGPSLQYESFATLIAELQLGIDIGNTTTIDKLGVLDSFRKQGLATFMIKRVISWAKQREYTSIQLTACTNTERYDNGLTQKELIEFYEHFGFKPLSIGSSKMQLNL